MLTIPIHITVWIYTCILTNGLMCTVKKLRMMYYELCNQIVLPTWKWKSKTW